MTPDRALTTPPTRFRAAEARGAQIGHVLKTVGRVGEVDENQLALIGRRFMERDEVGACLARAMRSHGEHRVTMTQFHQALTGGIESVQDAPPALREFFATVDRVPEWVDVDLLNEGARAYRRFGGAAADVLLQLALLGGYRYGGPGDLLVATGGLTGGTTKRRLGETQKWAVAVSEHDGMQRGGEGFQLTVHVRLMHALVNHRFESGDRWDTSAWGLPINQSDQAATLGLFNGALLLGVRALGVRVTAHDSRAVMHLWKYVGWLVGVSDDWLFDTERDQHAFNYHVLLAQADVTEAGPQLASSILQAHRSLYFHRLPRLRRAYGQARLLSMLRLFLGKRGMHDLGLPVRLPWAAAAAIARNGFDHHVLGRTAWGHDRLHTRGVAARQRILYRHFGDDAPKIAQLKV